MRNRDDKGRFPKGTSGNPNGAPRGPRRGLTTKQRAEVLAKGDQKALDTILELMDSTNDNLKIKAAISWVTESIKTRELLMKEIEHALKMKKLKQEIKDAEQSDFSENDDYKAPIISLKAITD